MLSPLRSTILLASLVPFSWLGSPAAGEDSFRWVDDEKAGTCDLLL
ncbi:MAG: hypothetical protein IT428_28135, partial [Planctomycetaceae bacterium]|nr:hypothetical protein [Planctomycetaceae bacterium]